MRILTRISKLNKKIPQSIRFLIGLILLNIPVIIYLHLTGVRISTIYVGIVFLLINISALLAFFKFKVIEVENRTFGKIKIKK
jgi:hypothetical protein